VRFNKLDNPAQLDATLRALPKTSSKAFSDVLGDLIGVCSRHGTVGPGGIGYTCGLSDAEIASLRLDAGFYPNYYLLEDRLSEHSCTYVDIFKRACMNEAWVWAVAGMLRHYDEWIVSVSNIDDGGILIGAKQVWVAGFESSNLPGVLTARRTNQA